MNIVKRNAAVLCSLLFLLVAAVDTATGGDYADGKLGKALILTKYGVTPQYDIILGNPFDTVEAHEQIELVALYFLQRFGLILKRNEIYESRCEKRMLPGRIKNG